MPQNTSIKKNFAYKSILTLSTYLIGFITFPYVSRVLGVERIGLVNFVDNTVNYFLLFASMGVGMLGVREIAGAGNDKETRNRIYSNILGINLLFTAATIAVYLTVITAVPKLHQYSELFYIGTAKILFTAFVIEWFFTGIENFRYITLRSVIIKTLYVAAVFLTVKSQDDYKLYFILTVSIVVVNAVINTVYARRFVSIRPRELLSLKYMRQNCTLGIYAVMTSMYLTFNVMYLGLVSDNTQVGYYTTAFKLYSVILGFFTAFTNVMLPRMSALLAEGDKGRFDSLINKSFSAMAMFCIPMILCSIIMAPQIVFVLSGEGYEGAVLPMRIIMPAALAVGTAQVLAVQILMPMKRDKALLAASVTGAATSLALNLLIVPNLQSTGTAIVLLCSETVVTSTYLLYAIYKKLTKIPLQTLLNSFIYSLPSAVVCFASAKWIANPYVALTTTATICIMIYLPIYRKILFTNHTLQKN